MNIYLTVSYRGASENKEDLLKLISHLESTGHRVSRRVFRSNSDKLESEEESIKNILSFKNADLAEIHKTILRKIREADVVIADTSTSSSSVGYEIAMAQAERKPILVLHNKKRIGFLADILGGNTAKIFKLVQYDEIEKSLAEVDAFLKSARDMIDTKFILIISPEIDRYLEWVAEERRMHKAQVVRNAIEDMMAKDKDYKQYAKDSQIG